MVWLLPSEVLSLHISLSSSHPWNSLDGVFPRSRVQHFSIPSYLLGWCLFGLKTALLSPSLEKVWLFGDSSPLCFLNTPVTSLPSHLLYRVIGTISCQSFLTERRSCVSPLCVLRAYDGACTQKAPSKCCGRVSSAAILINDRNEQISTKILRWRHWVTLKHKTESHFGHFIWEICFNLLAMAFR